MFGLGGPHRPKVVAFDIIGTTFSMEPLRPALEELGLPASSLELLYAESTRDAMAIACTGGFQPFTAVMRSALGAILSDHMLNATEAEIDGVLGLMRSLPPHPGAKETFELLRTGGLGVVALSNGAASATRSLLEGAGMVELVDDILSVDGVKASKPRPEVYGYAARTSRCEPKEMMLVASHPWDVNGAKRVGLLGGYVCRCRPYPDNLMQAPDVEGEDLLAVAKAILAMRP